MGWSGPRHSVSEASTQPDRKASAVSEPTGCCACPPYCDHCDIFVGLGACTWATSTRPAATWLVVTVESASAAMGCPTCGVVVHSHGLRTVTMVDTPCFGRPMRARCRKRTWECVELSCPRRVFTEHNDESVDAGGC